MGKPFRQRCETEVIAKNGAHFYFGTIYQRPRTWIIAGLFHPSKTSGDGGSGWLRAEKGEPGNRGRWILRAIPEPKGSRVRRPTRRC